MVDLTKMAPKSILKKPADTERTRKYKAAVQQAHLLQQQKDVEEQIFSATVELLDFPSDAETTSSHPTGHDVEAFRKLITPFQPSDYDTLLDERRIADQCGYVFCRSAPVKQDTKARFRVLSRATTGSQGFKVVEREKLEQFCSADCAKRALYVKVQLNEEPAWIRRGGAAPAITILTGDVCKSDDLLAVEAPEDDEQLQKAMRDLAIERGDLSSSDTSSSLIKDRIVENHAPTAGE